MANIGDRVGVIANVTHDTVEMLGYGRYLGSFPVDDNPRCISAKIVLDNGAEVWGYQCYWAPELQIIDRCRGKRVVYVDPPKKE
jgi:hypothetical protein